MYLTLNAPAIGITGKTLGEVIALARQTGFAGVDFDAREALALAGATSVAAVQSLFGDMRAAQWGLPVNGPQSEWAVDLAELAACARLARALGCRRCATWVPSWSDSRDLDENIAFHVTRLRPVAQVLADEGCALGLEFLGPKTLLDGHRFGFVRSMPAMLDIGRQIGTGNVGLLLDAWHLYTSGGTLADLATLTPADIVHVHINDAPIGVAVDELIDSARFLPMETGGIDLKGFMQGLAAIGYDGPVVTEPFNARLNDIAARDPAAAAGEVAAAMRRLWQVSGLA